MMYQKLKLSLFIFFGLFGVPQAWGIEGGPAQQPPGTAYKQNNCVNVDCQGVVNFDEINRSSCEKKSSN